MKSLTADAEKRYTAERILIRFLPKLCKFLPEGLLYGYANFFMTSLDSLAAVA